MSQPQTQRLSLSVNRVASTAEAETLLAAGADYVGFQANDMALFELEADPVWSDDRYVYAADIDGYISGAPDGRCIIDLPVDQIDRQTLDLIAQKGGHCVQISSLLSPEPDTLVQLEETGLNVIYAGRYLSPGDGPGLQSLALQPFPRLEALDLQVFPSETDAFKLLHASPQDTLGEVILLDDVLRLAEAIPLILSLNLTPENAADVAQTFANTAVRGLSITLSTQEHGAYHTLTPEDAARVLPILKGHI